MPPIPPGTNAYFHVPSSLLPRHTAQAAGASFVHRARRLAASANRRCQSARWGPPTLRRAPSPSPCATTASPACWHPRSLRSPAVMLARYTYADFNRALLSAVACADTHSSACTALSPSFRVFHSTAMAVNLTRSSHFCFCSIQMCFNLSRKLLKLQVAPSAV
jgi:hypothetical protein